MGPEIQPLCFCEQLIGLNLRMEENRAGPLLKPCRPGGEAERGLNPRTGSLRDWVGKEREGENAIAELCIFPQISRKLVERRMYVCMYIWRERGWVGGVVGERWRLRQEARKGERKCGSESVDSEVLVYYSREFVRIRGDILVISNFRDEYIFIQHLRPFSYLLEMSINIV